jgi:hypothetical protein
VSYCVGRELGAEDLFMFLCMLSLLEYRCYEDQFDTSSVGVSLVQNLELMEQNGIFVTSKSNKISKNLNKYIN